MGKKVVIGLIAATCLAYFLLLLRVDFSLFEVDREVFWLQLSAALGSIFGFIGITLMLWQVTLGVRHIVRIFTPDLIWATKVHTLIGKYGLLLILLHPLLIMYSYLEDLLWIVTPDIASDLGRHIALGRMALILIFLIYITSVLLRSRLKYRPWLYIHYLTYPIILLVFLHARTIGTSINEIPALGALWYTLLAGFILVVIIRILTYGGFFKKKYSILSIEQLPNNQYKILMKPESDKIDQEIGQFLYYQLKRFGESHPFTTARYEKKSGNIEIYFQAIGKFTENLARKSKGDQLFVDGPYGVFTKEGQNKKPKVLLAGGIGITPFIELINRHSGEDTYLFYSVKNKEAALETDMFQQRLSSKYCLLLTQDEYKGQYIENQRMDKDILLKRLGDNDPKGFNYFICGRTEFIKDMRKMLKDLQLDDNQIFFEEFTI